MNPSDTSPPWVWLRERLSVGVREISEEGGGEGKLERGGEGVAVGAVEGHMQEL